MLKVLFLLTCSLLLSSGVLAQGIVIEDDSISIGGGISIEGKENVNNNVEISPEKEKLNDVILNTGTIADIKNILVVDAASYGRPLVKMKLGLSTTIILPNNEAIRKIKNSNVNSFEILHRPTKENPNKIVFIAKKYDDEADLDILSSSGKTYYFTLYGMPSYSTDEPSLFVYVGNNPIAADAIENTGDEMEINIIP